MTSFHGYDGVNPDLVIIKLQLLDEKYYPPTIGPFYRTYGTWDSLSEQQKLKVIQYFDLLSDSVQQDILNSCHGDTLAHYDGGDDSSDDGNEPRIANGKDVAVLISQTVADRNKISGRPLSSNPAAIVSCCHLISIF